MFEVGDRFIKLHAPHFSDEFTCERDVLRVLESADFAAPRVSAAGSFEGPRAWSYLITSRVPGLALDRVWPQLDRRARVELCTTVGQLASVLHAVKPVTVTEREAWAAFTLERRQGCEAHQQREGVSARWLEQIPGFLADVKLDPEPRMGLLHTELMRQHVFVEREGPRWVVRGLIDFAGAQVGDVEYELAAVGLFVSNGDAELFAAFLDGYGWTRRDEQLPRRAAAWALLHRHSNLRWFLDRLSPTPTTLEDFARRVWSPQSPRQR